MSGAATDEAGWSDGDGVLGAEKLDAAGDGGGDIGVTPHAPSGCTTFNAKPHASAACAHPKRIVDGVRLAQT